MRDWLKWWWPLLVLLAALVFVIFVIVFVIDWSPHRHAVTREDFGNGVSCYVWGGEPISCERTP